MVSGLVRGYLALFFIFGCTPRPEPVSVFEARRMETRVLAHGFDKVFKASINSLQDLRFTIDVIDSDVGLIVASRQTEGQLTRLVEEPPEIKKVPTWKKILGITLFLAIIGGIFLLITRGGDDDATENDNDEAEFNRRDDHGRGHDDHGGGVTTVVRESAGGTLVHAYRLTLNFEAISDDETRLRVSGSGMTRRGDTLYGVGAIEDPAFFQKFYGSLYQALALD